MCLCQPGGKPLSETLGESDGLDSFGAPCCRQMTAAPCCFTAAAAADPAVGDLECLLLCAAANTFPILCCCSILRPVLRFPSLAVSSTLSQSLRPKRGAGRFLKACCRNIGAMIKHESGFYVVDKMIPAAEGPELLSIAAQLLATQFDYAVVGKFANANARLVDKLVRLVKGRVSCLS